MHCVERTAIAPAKINLWLRVVGRRADGYHELDSLFVPVSLADEVTVRFTAAPQVEVTCLCPGRPELEGPDNLAARAARKWLARTGGTGHVRISITKQIWAAAGLGGGSSDAAAVLRVLNDCPVHGSGEGLSVTALSALAVELGADVPFFLDPRPARGRGIGDELASVDDFPELHLVLANPKQHVATAEVFSGLGLAPGTHLDVTLPPEPTRLDGSLDQLARLMVNDLEAPALRICPAIGALKQELVDRGAVASAMSGSGATVFGVFPRAELAHKAADAINGPKAWAVDVKAVRR